LAPDLRAVEGEADQDLVPVDLHRLHLADVDAGDAHLVSGVQAAGVAELGEVVRLREDHGNAGEALAHADDEHQDDDAHHPVADPVVALDGPHCGVHLPDG